MNFRDRLEQAAQRGRSQRSVRANEEAARALSEEECKRRHASHRRGLTDHIERCLKQLADGFPGFQLQAVMEERGWGAAVVRDDVGLDGGKRKSLYSRLQVIVGPFTEYRVLAIEAKGTIRNKETFSRHHYQSLAEVDDARFRELIELWVLDYAEMYAAT